jgi:hypothetical protein
MYKSGATRHSCTPVSSNVNATGLRTALWRYDLGAELPLLADGSPRPKPTYTTEGYQVFQSNDGIIGIPRGVKERTSIAAASL